MPTIFRRTNQKQRTKKIAVTNTPAASSKKRLPQLQRVSTDRLSGFRLTERDSAIIQAFSSYHAPTTENIETLLFSPSTRSRCLVRLKNLYHHGFLLRTEQPQSLTEGRKPLVYWLDKKGAELIAINRGIEFADVGWKSNTHKVGPQFLSHLLDTNTVRVHVVRSANTHGFTVSDWQNEATLRHAHAADTVTVTTPQGTRQDAIVIPDSYFVLVVSKGGGEARQYPCFVETDRRTVTGQAQEWSHGQHDWAKKITTYLAYIRTGKYSKPKLLVDFLDR